MMQPYHQILKSESVILKNASLPPYNFQIKTTIRKTTFVLKLKINRMTLTRGFITASIVIDTLFFHGDMRQKACD